MKLIRLLAGDDPTKTMTCGPGSSATPAEQTECKGVYLSLLGPSTSLTSALNGWKVYGTE